MGNIRRTVNVIVDILHSLLSNVFSFNFIEHCLHVAYEANRQYFWFAIDIYNRAALTIAFRLCHSSIKRNTGLRVFIGAQYFVILKTAVVQNNTEIFPLV